MQSHILKCFGILQPYSDILQNSPPPPPVPELLVSGQLSDLFFRPDTKLFFNPLATTTKKKIAVEQTTHWVLARNKLTNKNNLTVYTKFLGSL